MAVVATVLWIPALNAADSDRFPIAGVGAFPCGIWQEFRKVDQHFFEMTSVSWLQGFLSAMNLERANTKDLDPVLIPEPPTLIAYIDKYCRDNPLNSALDGAKALYQDLQKR